MSTSQVHCTRSAKQLKFFLLMFFYFPPNHSQDEKRNFRDLDDLLVTVTSEYTFHSLLLLIPTDLHECMSCSLTDCKLCIHVHVVPVL